MHNHIGNTSMDPKLEDCPTLPSHLKNGDLMENLKKGIVNKTVTKKMVLLWVHQALMVDLLRRLPTTPIDTEETIPKEAKLTHLRWMLETASTTLMEPDKAARWLGYVQGIATIKGWIDVTEERDRTRPLLHLKSELFGEPKPKSYDPE